MQLSQKQNILLTFSSHFWNLDEILNKFKKVRLIEFAFSKWSTLKTQPEKCLKSPVSDNGYTSNMVNVSKHY